MNYLPRDIKADDNDNDSKEATVIGGRWVPGFSWILTYLFDRDVDFKKFYTSTEIKTPKELLIADSDFNRIVSADKDEKTLKQIRTDYDDTKMVLELKQNSYPFDTQNYPYSRMKIFKRQTMTTLKKGY